MCYVHYAMQQVFPMLSQYYSNIATDEKILQRIQPQATLGEINVLHREAHAFLQTGVLADDFDTAISLIACKVILLKAKHCALRFNVHTDSYEFLLEESE